ncbi:type 4 fimbrial biogenesis protein PilY1 [Legionella santicrucis]|uniref:Type 4 fimbrial biogenesis protein PilY1 n=1 Tax=Legionella santicrucis TaxID=45074 RepID=A0A0W0YWP7_9GAMM|nr:PilC/PilY family type IV pilus protein [Legionella santicrucis]KTD61289.1 type 4 fimbrial biogenesis protein PilY1 [Legionella santicrucis]
MVHARSKSFRVGLKTLLFFMVSTLVLAASTPILNIPQIPLIMASPIHPQVLIAIGNSQSMDGDLSGAIMSGSGSLTGGLTSLKNSSSPLNYTVPTGFTPPVQAANSSGQALYTVSQNGVLVDNSASRLNVAKSGVQAIINTYMQSTDFALATYKTSSVAVYNTWVYYMSPQGSNFSFTNTPVTGNTYVNNPCYNYTSASSTIQSNCSSIGSFYGSSVLSSNAYMQIGATSDNPSINDVLYAGSGFPGIFLTYNGPSPATPYPPNFSISNYNNGGVLISYSKSLPNIGGFGTSPTNAGFVPYSPQVLYSQRGFGYSGSQSATSGTILVPMTSAGTNPTTTSINNAIGVFTPYLQPETNATSTKEIKASAVQSPVAGLMATAKTYLSSLGNTSGNGCPQKKYVILISDGLPTQDLNGKLWPPLGSAAATGYGITATFNPDGSLQSTNCQALTDAISTIAALKQQGIPTYIIGLGAGVNPSLNPQAAASLTAMAVAGGTTNYYPATNSTDLVNDLNAIMISVQNGSFTTSAAAVSSTQLNNNSVEYEANFISNDKPYQDWTGNLLAMPLNPTTGLPTGAINWQAQPLLDTLVSGSGWFTNRFIVTWNPSTNTGIPFEWADISTTQQTELQPSDALGQQRLQYLRGNTSLEMRNGGSFRNRSHILGDIIDSQVIYIGAPSSPYTSSSYLSFAKTYANRSPLLYVGANDGMLHAFNATTGNEVFAFIPNAVFANLYNLTNPLYNLSHRYFVDGSPQTADVQFPDSSWHTLLVGGENAGGNSIYGLDITNPNNFLNETNLAQKVLWEFTDSDMGLSYSQPQIAQIGANTNPATFAVFFGNGYNSPNNTSVLYAINPQTGALISKINLCNAVPGACNSSLPQGLSSVAIANQNGFQGAPITNVYAGDLQGNMWSVNVSDPNPTNWTVRLLFQAKDSSGAVQPITTAPVVTLNPAYPRVSGLFVIFGTGQLLQTSDLLNTQTQTIYGVLDKPLTSVTYTRSNLQQQTLNLISTSTSGLSVPVVTASSTPINWYSQFGWYDDLVVSGQRIVTNPTVFNGAFISTLNTPPQSCSTSFTSMLLELNFKTGGAFTNPQIIGVNANGTPNNQYNYSGVVGVQLSNSFANAATLVGPNQGNNIVLLITQSNGSQSTILNPNSTRRRTGWWQLQ